MVTVPGVDLGEPFDASDALREPEGLHGRDEEAAALLSALDRAGAGEALLVLVTGPAGIGKSALAGELRAAALRRGARFALGEFEPRGQGAPSATVVGALRELGRQLLAEPADRFEAARARLRRAVGPCGSVITELVPELGLVLGPQPPLPEIGAAEAQDRFRLILQGCLRALCTAERPVVLVFEHLQWADPASLDRIRLALSDPEARHLLVVCTCRAEEIGPDHPSEALLRALAQVGVPVKRIPLQPLGLAAVARTVEDALGGERAALEPLAALVHEQARGNPLVVQEHLRALVAEGLLRFDRAAGAWRWDPGIVRAAATGRDVLGRAAETVQRLSPGARGALRIAAALGYTFDVATVAVASDRAPAEVAAALQEAADRGLLVPAAGEPRRSLPPDVAAPAEGRYRFAHDRAQQAADALTPDAERVGAHLRIGRRLLARDGGLEGERLFDALEHLHLGAAALDDPEERIAVARLDLEAGRRAKARAAYDAAREHFAAALSLLGDGAWEREHDLAFALGVELAEHESLCGRREAAAALFAEVAGRARGEIEGARVASRRVALCVRLSRFDEAMDVSLSALARFGVTVADPGPAGESEAPPRPLALDIDAPPMTDERAAAIEDLLLGAILSAYFEQPGLFAPLLRRWYALVEAHGHSDQSAFGYALYGVSLVGDPASWRESYDIGRFALALNERRGNTGLTCKLVETFAGNIAFLQDGLRSVLAHFPRAIEAGLAAGDFMHVAYVCCHVACMRLGAGDELEATCEDIDARRALAERTRDAISADVLRVAAQAARNLLGRTEDTRSLSGEGWDEAEILDTLRSGGSAILGCYYHTTRCTLHVVYGRFGEAALDAERAEATGAGRDGQFFATQLAFFGAIARLGAGEPEGDVLAAYRHRLLALADACPESFLAMHLAVSAEVARARGRHGDARELYDDAADAAARSGFPHQEAIACELAARYYLGRGRGDAARPYLDRAVAGYVRWGARAKVRALLAEHPGLRAPPGSGAGAPAVETAAPPLLALDVVALMRAAGAIAAEIELDRLLERLMRTVLEVGGADRGALLLARDGELTVEAMMTVDPDTSRVGLSAPLAAVDEIAASVVHYVARTREPVLLADPAKDARFAADPWIAAHRPAAILCLPLLHRSALTGVVVLENRAARGALGQDRVDVLSLLSSQAAIAVENALLLSDVRRRTADLRRANEDLGRELAERERAEAERAALQARIIDMQRARLAELSTPLIPITGDVMVMPLVGTMDGPRAEEMLRVALEGAATRGARAVILDITGVKVVDSQVAATLLSTVQDLKLLGAEAVITGVRGHVAQALLHLDLEFAEKVVTRTTLQAGIAHALGRTRRGAAGA